MGLTRKLMLLAGMALAAIAFSATPAAAQETGVEVNEEHNGVTEACAPCQIHAVGESVIRRTIDGAPISNCTDEFEGVINHDGTGEITWVGVTDDPTIGCNVVNCASPEDHWPLSNAGELGNGVEHFTARFCLNAGLGDSHCNAEVSANDDVTPHEYEFSTHQICSGGATEVEGHWTLEHTTAPHDEIEIHHLDDEGA